jgi:hypothetical protein
MNGSSLMIPPSKRVESYFRKCARVLMVVECDFVSHQEKGDLRQIQQEKEEGAI